MGKKKSLGGQLVPRTPQAQQQARMNVANSGTNLVNRPTKKDSNPRLLPGVSVESRTPAYLQMMMNPIDARPALPPESLPARAIPLKQYQEVLLSTDVNGSCGVNVTPLMAAQYNVVSSFTGTTINTFVGVQANAEYASFLTNFLNYIPLVYEVVVRFTGNDNNVAGRMYGIVGPGGNSDVTKFPLEPNGCEGMTSDGISCTWYGTGPVWANPATAASTTTPAEWLDTTISVAMIGGPPSVANIVSVGIWLHLAAFPKSGVCGLTPMAALPDPTLQYAAALMSASDSGVGASALTLKQRDKYRKTNAVIRDVVKHGGQVLGTIYPQLGGAISAASALMNMLQKQKGA